MDLRMSDVLTIQTLCMKLIGILAALHSAIIHFTMMGHIRFSVYVYMLLISTPIELNAIYDITRGAPISRRTRDKMSFVEHLTGGIVCNIAGWVLLTDVIVTLDKSLIFGGIATVIAGCMSFTNAYFVHKRLTNVYVAVTM